MGRISRRSFGGLSLGAAAWAASLRSLRAQEQVIRTHGGSLLGALKYPEGFAHFDYVNPDAPKGGTARIATSGSFDSFNPFIVKGDPPTGIGLIFDTLMESALDEGSTHYCALAEWEEHPADDSWVAFRLRDEARWHDGRPITVDDVIWTFRTLIDKGVPNYRFYYQNVVDVRDMGDRVVRFDFDQAGNRELPHIMGQLVVLPKHWWEDGRDFEAGGLEPMLGSGPTGSAISRSGASSNTSASRTTGAGTSTCMSASTISTGALRDLPRRGRGARRLPRRADRLPLRELRLELGRALRFPRRRATAA
jgi:ABC-type oligopeptide transport system substrate-binding subunit